MKAISYEIHFPSAPLNPQRFFTHITMRVAPTFACLFKDWLLSFVGWASVGVVQGLPMIATHQLSWPDILMLSAHDWLPWAVLTPLIWRLVKHLPLERGTWLRSIPAHLVGCILVVGLSYVWKEKTGPYLHPGLRVTGPAAQLAQPVADVKGAPLPSPLPIAQLSMTTPPAPGQQWLILMRLASFELPTYLLLLSVSHAVLFSRRQREREAGLAQTRLEILQMRLQPHFLFNTLNTISGLVHEEPDKADAMLTDLSELLRLALRNSTAFVLPLSREMEILERYVAIMKTRFEDRLTFQSEIQPDTSKALVPALLLQPLVENAVQHGLDLESKRGVVSVQARREGKMLRLSVKDNGEGFVQDTWAQEGVGLGTTRARLMELYGKQASLRLVNHDGFTVEILLPFKQAE